MKAQKTQTAFISIGSNMGDRLRFCQKAVAALCKHPEIQLTKISSLYETEPVDFLKQDHFYNAVIAIETYLSPEKLLQSCQEIEAFWGKNIVISKGPRTLDLDLLFYNALILKVPDLILPHPEIARRLFVLIPFAEIAPKHMHPLAACSIENLLKTFRADQFKTVEKRFNPGWENESLCSKIS